MLSDSKRAVLLEERTALHIVRADGTQTNTNKFSATPDYEEEPVRPAEKLPTIIDRSTALRICIFGQT